MYYFTSDVHLGAGGEQWSHRTEQRFVRWLDMAASDADGIFLLGDIFDFWWEYRKVVPKGFVRTFGKLAELTDRGIKIYLITGNHDMWAKDYLKKECGVEVFFTPQQITLHGKNLFLAHGDNMNIGNKPLLRLMNAGFRSKTLRTLFSWLVHPDVAMTFGQWWSGTSRKSHSDGYLCVESLSFLIDYAKTYKESNPQTDYIIFGHMHYPHYYQEGNDRICFLSNWDDEVQYATLDDDGTLSLKTFEQ
ncbi:MAG: UDP-2,3-diacylglucosamine diphosphatase [Alistipes sp.]|nr:UDP-2,3-diacylglucosamine diphosphatase [Alistipes sp.]